METIATSTGISLLDEMAWGRHTCYFYETQQDLLRTLVPYFQAGLENNELCLWMVSNGELLSIAEAWSALRQGVPDLDRYLAEGRIEIVNQDEWFSKGVDFNIHRLFSQLHLKLNRALAKGYTGMRVSEGQSWLLKLDRRAFPEFEDELDNLIAGRRMMILCNFPLETTGAAVILDAARTHQFVSVLRQGKWERVESPDRVDFREEVKPFKPGRVGDLRLERLTPRQREVLVLTARGSSMKEVALLLNISVKTVETHRSNLMERLDLHDVPSLVRFAIKAGLINLED